MQIRPEAGRRIRGEGRYLGDLLPTLYLTSALPATAHVVGDVAGAVVRRSSQQTAPVGRVRRQRSGRPARASFRRVFGVDTLRRWPSATRMTVSADNPSPS